MTLREARKQLGLRIEDVASKAGVSRATLYRLESGETPDPAYSTVVRLEEALGLGRGTLVFAGEVRGAEGGAAEIAAHANDRRRGDRRSGLDRRGVSEVAS